MKDENETNAPAPESAPAAPKPSPKPAPKPRDPYILSVPRTRTTTATIPTAIAAPSASRCSKPIRGANSCRVANLGRGFFSCPGW